MASRVGTSIHQASTDYSFSEAARRLPTISMMTGRTDARMITPRMSVRLSCTKGTLPRSAPTRMKPAPHTMAPSVLKARNFG